MGKVKGAVMLAVGAFVAIGCIITSVSSPKTAEKVKSAVYVEDGRVLAENEGKLVVISGKLVSELPLIDSVTDVELPCITAKRLVQVYTEKETSEEISREWEPVNEDYTKEGNYGINTEKLVSSVLIAPTSLGEFNISDELLMPISRSEDITSYDEDNLKQNGWELFDINDSYGHKYYISADESLPGKRTVSKNSIFSHSDEVGKVRVRYTRIPSDDPLVYTLIGIQKGNTLVKADNLDVPSVYKGELTPEDIADKETGNPKSLMIFGIIVGGVLIFFGIRKLIRKTEF